MTARNDFSDEQWRLVVEGPPSAGMIVITAAKGGMLRETWAMSKVYAEARHQHGASELLDAIVAAKPEMDHTKYKTPEELKQRSLQHIRDAVALLETKTTPAELADYRSFVLTVANKVAAAHKEHGVAVSPTETDAVQEITTALGSSATTP